MKIQSISNRLTKNLKSDLLLPKYLNQKHPLGGHCYVASEALFHVLGGKSKGFKSMHIRHENTSHWWVQGPKGQIWDLTADQFTTPVPYEKSMAKGFLTKNPCKRTQILLKRAGFYELQT